MRACVGVFQAKRACVLGVSYRAAAEHSACNVVVMRAVGAARTAVIGVAAMRISVDVLGLRVCWVVAVGALRMER